MDNCSQNTKRDLPNTPRVCGKILEYYLKFGQERDLEKFMRLYSPVSSQDSEKSQGICAARKTAFCRQTKSSEQTNSCEILDMIPLNSLSICGETNSKSLPNIDIQGKIFSEEVYAASSDVIVDINVVADGEKDKVLIISKEDLKTPKKIFKSTKTQTPESIAKTHRRLEWDSLGDIGYKKSMSTGNISVMERSLLKEFFKEKSDHNSNADQLKTIQKLKTSEIENNTPPLASSTLVSNTELRAKTKKMLSQSTSSTTLNERFEKYAQTSIIKLPSVRSQEVQCNLSSSYSIVEETATPSSFEYYSSRSSKSSDMINANARKQVKPQEHPFITSITDLLLRKKPLGEKNLQKRQQLNNIKDLQTKFQAALHENKENQIYSTADSSSATSFLLSKKVPDLDLGIQLICSLIDAKSINGRQKKQFIRDIINRLTRMEGEDKTYSSTTDKNSEDADNSSGVAASSFSNFRHQNVYDSVKSVSNRSTTVQKTNEESHSSNTKISEVCNNILTAKQPKSPLKSRSQCFPESRQQQIESSCEHFPVKRNHNAFMQNSIRVLRAATIKNDKGTQSETILTEQNLTNRKLAPITIEAKDVKANRCAQTLKVSSTCTSSAATTPDLITQKHKAKTNPELNNSNTDADQPTMREWLNPLTQSEIEYEEKKQIEIKKKAVAYQEKLIKKSKHDCGREQHLNWIEKEMKRLECLKYLLLKDDTTTRSSTSVSSLHNSSYQNSNKNSNQTDKLYDTAYTDKSSVLTENAEKLVQEIAIILEESHEDVVNSKHSTDRKMVEQLVYETDFLNEKFKTKTLPKLHIVNENINYNEEQLLKQKEEKLSVKEQNQREKIDTPSTDVSKESKSIKDMVFQRKQEFMKAYKSKKQHHYDALQQQQKQDFKYSNLPQNISLKSTTTTDSDHYSVPHTIPRKFVSGDVAYYAQQPLPKASIEQQEDKPKLISPQQSFRAKIKEPSGTKSANANNYTTASSSSVFCMSSDISVPMGSPSTSSSPIFTHRYDDKGTVVTKTGVAVQTSDSIRFSKPIFGPGSLNPTCIPHNPTISKSTACIQVKPKGIAYIIEFDDNKKVTSNPDSDTEINSNGFLTKPNEISQHSYTKKVNNLKSPSENEKLLTLQEHLEKSKPNFLKHSKERKAILNQLQSMRQERVRQLREIIGNTSLNSLDRRLHCLPPPPIQTVRILKTKEMKALTNKRFASLPEIVAKQKREIEENKRRSNRILRDVFNKRLQKRVRSGKLSLNHSKAVI